MATTAFGVNHPLAVKAWSAKLFHEAIGQSYVGRFMGTSDSSLIQIKTETQKDAGDKVTFGLRKNLTAAGIQGDDTLEGNEEALQTYSDSVLIDQLRTAVRSAGKMSEQRVPFSVREEARMGLQDWWTERIETSAANQLAGNSDQSDTRYTGNNTALAPSSGRLIVGGDHATEASLSATTTHAIKLADLDKAVAIAKEPSTAGASRIRPIRVDGKEMWVCFLHPYQVYQLRRDASTAGNFFDVQKAALQGGKISDNPIFTGASFVYNNVIVHEWNYLPNVASSVTSNTSYRRGVFCGAQAMVAAFGQGGAKNKMSWEEELFDYGNQLGVAAGMIFGFKKARFNSIDFSTIVLSGYAPAPV
jgi:N4-gp56 family major capsid protein